MFGTPLNLRLTGALSLREGTLQQRSVVIEDGYISKGPLPEVDASGYMVMPGIIDLHGDAFERHIAPRPSAPFPILQGLAATDREAASHGVTTAFLAQSWSWEGGVRGPEYAEQLLVALDVYNARQLVDLRVQLRCETHTVETSQRLIEAVRQHKVGYVIFNNHLPEAVELAEAKPLEIALWAKKAGRTPDEHMVLVKECLKQTAQVPRYLCTLASAFDEMGVVYGSHDDPDALTREYYSMIGAKISEFPTSVAAAAAAHAVGDVVLMGAPNIVRGGSQAGNISAQRLVESGLCDALISDYYYPALHAAAFHLVDKGVMDLPSAWRMISTRPAEILRLPDRGIIDFGKRADLTIINAVTREIEATIVRGRLAYMSGEIGARLVSALHKTSKYHAA